VRVVDPDRATLRQRHRGQPLAVAGDEVQAREQVADERVVVRRRALEDVDAGDVHVGVAAVLEMQERGVEPAQSVAGGHASIVSCSEKIRQVQQSVECCGTLGICLVVPMDLSDPRAFSAVYDQHSAAVFGTALRILGNRAQAQDVTQDVFLRLWRNPRRFDARRGELGPYLRLMARSRALDVWREGQAAGRASDRLKLVAAREDGRPDDRPGALIDRDGDRATVRAALGRLPDAQREALVLAYWGGLTADQIARRAGVPLGTAKSRIRLGLAKVRAEVGPELELELEVAA
jgi:RNA polymerase sigma-70 factor (ECF subfamily)